MRKPGPLHLHHLKNTTQTTATNRWHHLPLLVLFVLASAIIVMRLYTYREPFERDITSHAVIGHEALAGRRLYSDLWDSKPPAIFVTYAAADALVGYGEQSVYLIGIAAAIITLLGAYRAGSAYGGTTGGLWAAVFWAFICSDLWLWANQPNIEVGINACLIWAFALMVRAGTERTQVRRWIAIGLLFAVATLYKPVAITFAVTLSCCYLLSWPRQKKTAKTALLQVCIAAATGATVWLAVFAYFAATERFGIFYDTIFTYAGYYAKSRGGNPVKNILAGLKPEHFTRTMKSTLVLAILSALGVACGIWRQGRHNWLLLLGFFLGAYLAVALPGRFYNHYYQLWLDPLVIGAGWAVATIAPKTIPTFIRHVVAIICLVILLCSVVPQYRFSADEWSAKKQGPQYIICKKLAAEINGLLEKDETLYVWGINPGLYFWTKRKPPTGVIWSTDTMDNPLAKLHTEQALQDLQRNPPEMLIVNMLHVKRPPDHPVIEWLSKNYVPLPGNPNRGLLYERAFLFCIYIRQDGRLAARLSSTTPR